MLLLGNAVAGGGQLGVGHRAAIAGDDFERLLAVGTAMQIDQQVEQLEVHRKHIAAAVIAQDVVDIGDGGMVIGAILPIGGFQDFIGMGVEETQGPAVDGSRFRHDGAGQEGEGAGAHQTETKERAAAQMRNRLVT